MTAWACARVCTDSDTVAGWDDVVVVSSLFVSCSQIVCHSFFSFLFVCGREQGVGGVLHVWNRIVGFKGG